MVAKLLKVNGEIKQVKPKGKFFTLSELQKLVGGYIEPLPCAKLEKCVVYGDEEGRLKNKPINVRASRMLGYVVVGDILIVPESLLDRA